MRLPDIVNQIQRRVSEGTNIIRHPFQAAYRVVRKRAQGLYESATIPGLGNDQASSPQRDERQPFDASAGADPSEDYASAAAQRVESEPSVLGNGNGRSPATTLLPQTTAIATLQPSSLPPSFLQQIPLLQPGEVLQGDWWGRYTVGTCIQELPWMRVYTGLAMNGGESIWIYEYLLREATFNQAEAEQRLQMFRQLVNQNLRLGNGSDFRIIKLKDVMVDAKSQRRGYLVTCPLAKGRRLVEYLNNWGAMSATQVRQVLKQVLQSLQYLHTTYRLRWLEDSNGAVTGQFLQRGLVHGNLTLETLWIRWSQEEAASDTKPFFIYLSRFSLWEHVFWASDGRYTLTQAAKSPSDLGSIAQDLKDLGRVAFALLSGDIPDAAGAYTKSPTDATHWPQSSEVQALKPFILRLLGLGSEEAFKSADTALVALRDLPMQVMPQAETEPTVQGKAAEPAQPLPWLLWVSVLLGLVMGGSLLYWLLRRSPSPIMAESCPEPCTITDAIAGNSGLTVNYAISDNTSWINSFDYFIGDFPTNLDASRQNNQNLQPLLEKRSSWNFNRQLFRDDADLIDAIKRQKLEFALMQNPDLASENTLKSEVLAHDGIVFFVVFSDENRDRSVSKLLDGKISWDTLKQLYSNLDTTLLNQPVKLYFPKDLSTVNLLKELLPTENQAEFDLLQQQDERDASQSKQKGENDDLYARMLKDFEANSDDPDKPQLIGIGFDRLSRMFGQCSVYPLALETRDKTYSILVEANGQWITPATDLCGDKGSYWINSAIFVEANPYPFSYDLAVVYPTCEDNEQGCKAGEVFADMMRSAEGQYLLSEVGLVPIEPVAKLRRILWSGNTP